ncbi:uncharacterized protein E5676_scaffold120G001850 [Cucumis melo var. makuwa]|uniref:Uncharacterized protein n=1 Tax=Cucumis melo var. makuwa TaxID=1194695 RepID=A0A5D3E0S0_CUCMM|nr:uncharacterized protein E6C27_scaffold186G002340 [Cucumis melo var. makuwa]TYK29065.1 uncharacterized protein E5676_scaffold120G001850 [Cucumis melo var. makuwa]
MDLTFKAGMSKTISNIGPFYPLLIKEFIVNLPYDFNNPSSPDFQTVHIRGLKFKISPTIINGFLGNTLKSSSTLSHLSNEVLAYVLSRGTLSVWLVNGIPVVSLMGSHVPDIEHDMRPSRNPRMFDTEDVDEGAKGFFVHQDSLQNYKYTYS